MVNFDKKIFPVDLYPRFVFNPILSEEKNSLVDRIIKLQSAGFVEPSSEADREFVRSIDNLPKESFDDTGNDSQDSGLGDLGVFNSDDNKKAFDKIEVLNYSEYNEL
jgi:hypothetical protein